MMPNGSRGRKGFVLASALLALLLIAALVAGVFFASTEVTRTGVAGVDGNLARMAAEASIERALAGWNFGVRSAAPVGQASSASDDAAGMPATVYITRLDSTVYWIVADAGPPRPQSVIRSRIGAFVRTRASADGSTTVDRIPERWWSELL
ncbi:MAG TPA: hypothetical protein VGG76_06460 [Gemmatimonadaceae bacterium]|jgi:Tfp pilus assembly protein PilX